MVSEEFPGTFTASSKDGRHLSRCFSKVEMNFGEPDHRFSDQWSETGAVDRYPIKVSDSGWVHRFTLREIEMATNGFAKQNVIGCGDYGVLYRGLLKDNTKVAVKRLMCISGRTEDFKVDIQTIGHVRHKNLVELLGYCFNGPYKMLVYEHIDNGTLCNWLHGYMGQMSPVSWGMRMNIILGVAKGLTYLHEDIEPQILHQGINSTNILLDHQWNPKISDFAIAKLLGPDWNLVRKSSGYAAGECSSVGVCTKTCDVFSFGVLVLEIITGRTPIFRNDLQEEVYLVDWVKSMVASQNSNHIVDPKLPNIPSSKELKRVILIALRCVDPEEGNRPSMADVIHMLEPRDLLLSGEQPFKREISLRKYLEENFSIVKDREEDTRGY